MKPEEMTIIRSNLSAGADDAKEAVVDRRPEFINFGNLYVARQGALSEDNPRFIMELDATDIRLILVGLSELLPDRLKLVDGGVCRTGVKINSETAARIYALGDSAREMLIRAAPDIQHNHVWSCLVGRGDATPTEQVSEAFGE